MRAQLLVMQVKLEASGEGGGEGGRGEGINCGQTAQCMQRVVAAYYACHRLFDLCNSLVVGGRESGCGS